ncbi:MAG: DUF1638 domain-containing protein [Desulfatiglandaceae bacterium]
MEARYGRHRAERVMDRMLQHYTHLAFIHTGTRNQAPYRRFAQEAADRLHLTYKEMVETLPRPATQEHLNLLEVLVHLETVTRS